MRSQVIVGGVVQGGDRHPQHSAEIFDIIRAMRTKAKNAVALSLAIAGVMASPLRSDAVSLKGSTPPLSAV